MTTNDVKMKFVELRAKGNSFDKIANMLKKSKQTLINWESEFKEEISNLKSIELDTLYEQFYVTKEARIKKLGGILEKIEKELDKRDLTQIPTETLFNLFLKYQSKLSDEFIEPDFKSEDEVKKIKNRRVMDNFSTY